MSGDVMVDGTPDGTSDGPVGRRRLAPIVSAAIAIVLLLLVVVMIRAGGDEASSAQTNLLDRPAPAVTGEFADGRIFELSRRKGSWVVLNFFTSTCIPCQREHPELIAFVEQQRGLGTAGAEFYTIVQHDEPAAVDAFFAANGGDWPIVYDNGFEFQNSFGVAQVPETWIIDPNGVVRGRIIAEVTADFLSTTIQRLREGA